MTCDLPQGTVLAEKLSKDLIMAVNLKGLQSPGNQTKSREYSLRHAHPRLGHLQPGKTWRKSEKIEVWGEEKTFRYKRSSFLVHAGLFTEGPG